MSIQTFKRTRFTWLAYGMLAYFAYSQSALGPIMPFLRRELGLSYTVGGLHASAFALGMVLVGLFGDGVIRRLGQRRAFWGGGAGMAVGTLFLATGQNAFVTIFGALVMGTLGTLLFVMVQTTLANAHERFRPVAFMEANVAAAVSTSFLPLLVGGLEGVGSSWRVALFFIVMVWLLMAFGLRETPFPSPVREGGEAAGRLPRVFWLYWLIIFLGVSAEWCVALWSADFLVVSLSLSPSHAASLVAVFVGAGVLGRLVGSRLARTQSSRALLLIYLLVLLGGFPLFWLGATLPLKVIGLAIVGFGAAGLFPLGLAAATDAVPTESERISTRSSLASGLAILINPQILGMSADLFGIGRAFGLVLLLGGLAVVLTLVVRKIEQR